MENTNTAMADLLAKRDKLEKQVSELAASVDSFDDPELVKVDQEIEKIKAAIRRLERFEQSQVTKRTTAELSEQRAARSAAYENAVREAKDRIALAEQIDATFTKLGEQLKQWDKAGQACHAQAATVHRDDSANGWQHAILEAARGNNHRFTCALEWAVFQSRIGETGIYLPTVAHRPLGNPYSIADAARVVAEDLEIRLRDCLKQANELDA